MRTATIVLLAGLATQSGCGITGPNPQRVIGVVEWLNAVPTSQVRSIARSSAELTPPASCCESDPVLEAPDTTTVGVAFDIVVRTFGPNGCWWGSGASTEGEASAVTITPFDMDRSGGKLCAQAIVRLPRTIKVTFSALGEGVIRVRGRRVVGANGDIGPDLVLIEKKVVVTN